MQNLLFFLIQAVQGSTPCVSALPQTLTIIAACSGAGEAPAVTSSASSRALARTWCQALAPSSPMSRLRDATWRIMSWSCVVGRPVAAASDACWLALRMSELVELPLEKSTSALKNLSNACGSCCVGIDTWCHVVHQGGWTRV